MTNGTSGGSAAWEKIADISVQNDEQIVIPLTKQYQTICGYLDGLVDSPDTFYIKLDTVNIISNPNWWDYNSEQRLIFRLDNVGYGVLAIANGEALNTASLSAGEATNAYITVHVGALAPSSLTITFGIMANGISGTIWGVPK